MAIVTGPQSALQPWRPAIDGTRYPCEYCGSTQIASSRGRCSVCDASKPVQTVIDAPHTTHGPGAAAPAVTPPRAHRRD